MNFDDVQIHCVGEVRGSLETIALVGLIRRRLFGSIAPLLISSESIADPLKHEDDRSPNGFA
jgi:hypothetical protein